MESPQLIHCNKTERVTIFKLPPLSTSKGFYLDDWKEMIWEGGVKVTQKNKILKISFVDKQGKLFGETKVPQNYREAISKTLDSSRGYAVRLENPKGGYLWVGVAFRDRNDAFDFGVVFQEYADRNKLQSNPNILKEQFGENIDYSLKKGQKIKIQVGEKKHKKEQTHASSSQNPFNFDAFSFNSSAQTHPNPPKQSASNNFNTDWFSDFSTPSTSSKPVESKKADPKNSQNLIDFD